MANVYTMKISRLTVEKLGVKLYDKVSAVIAELVSNSYDADAKEVIIEAPMGEYLASKAGGKITDKGRTIAISDNGIGMTPEEVNEFYLRVGAERRRENKRGRGDVSPIFGRRVMGSKGVGKLAPFGICQVVEVISAGGEEITRDDGNGNRETGCLTAHMVLNRADILNDADFDYNPTVGNRDDMLSPTCGTTVILRDFSYRHVPDLRTLARELAQRFGLPTENWRIVLRDTTKTPGAPDYETCVGAFDIATMEYTRITFVGPTGSTMSVKDSTDYYVLGPNGEKLSELEAGFHHDGRFFPVKGWTAYSREPYRDDLMAGVRVYCRGKIAAQTAIFNRRAGFHGEHSIRSYLVGELHVDWLDEEEDLIQTDRRDILWSHELGQAFQEWGQKVVLLMGSLARDPMRKKTADRFFEVGKVNERIEETFPGEDQDDIRAKARELARLLGRTIRADEVEDENAVEPMVELTLALAPHVTLDEKLRQAGDAETPVGALSTILRTARLAELSSFGRIAADRLKVIQKVQTLKDDPETAEERLQALLQYAPWLINPQWAPITANQAFTTLRREFEKFYKERTGQELTLGDFQETQKRPDFVLSSQDNGLQIIEIKKPAHKLTNGEMDRIITYHDEVDAFLNSSANAEFREIFRHFQITLVCDSLSLSGAQNAAFRKYKDDGMLTHINWATFLLRTEQMHRDFLQEAERQRRYVTEGR